ncbi:MAG TPA: FkbM family methyltransferase [Acidimicrobiales bacterium]
MAHGERASQDIRHLRDERGLRASEVDWERLLTINYCQYLQRGCSVIDVGAHHGMHSRRFLRYLRPAHLVLVEPVPEMAEGLRREFRRQPSVEVRQVALGLESVETTFTVNDLSLGESGLLERRYNEGHSRLRSIDVTVERLDDWDLPFTVDFVKVDVEGGEVDVLQGGRRFLADNRPIVSVEFGEASYSVYGHNAMTMHDLAVESGYAVADLFGTVIGAEEWPQVVNNYYWDFILLPEEMIPRSAAVRSRIRDKAMRSATHPAPKVERWRKRLRR